MKKGFTLVEIIVVIIILGVMGTVAIPRLFQQPESAILTAGVQGLNLLHASHGRWKIEHNEGSLSNCAGLDISTRQDNFNAPVCSDAGVSLTRKGGAYTVSVGLDGCYSCFGSCPGNVARILPVGVGCSAVLVTAGGGGGNPLDLLADPNNCGTAGHVCIGGLPVCSAGQCYDLSTISDCGSVGNVCATPSPACVGGQCVELSTDPNNCGSVGHVCPVSAPTCSGGNCYNFASDLNNCGTVGHVCTGSSPKCSNGDCYDCYSGMCFNLSKEYFNCGAFGAVCYGTETCVNGVCQAALPGGGSTGLRGDNNNCGAVGNVCTAGNYCLNGTCGPHNFPNGTLCLFVNGMSGGNCQSGFCMNGAGCAAGTNGSYCTNDSHCSSQHCTGQIIGVFPPYQGTCSSLANPLNGPCMSNGYGCQSGICVGMGGYGQVAPGWNGTLPGHCANDLGNACTANSECGSSTCSLGQCVLASVGTACTTGTTCISGICGSGSKCVNPDGGQCSANADCQNGYCNTNVALGQCTNGITGSAGCAAGTQCVSVKCDTYNHVCSAGTLAGPCGANADCASLNCDTVNHVCIAGVCTGAIPQNAFACNALAPASNKVNSIVTGPLSNGCPGPSQLLACRYKCTDATYSPTSDSKNCVLKGTTGAGCNNITTFCVAGYACVNGACQ